MRERRWKCLDNMSTFAQEKRSKHAADTQQQASLHICNRPILTEHDRLLPWASEYRDKWGIMQYSSLVTSFLWTLCTDHIKHQTLGKSCSSKNIKTNQKRARCFSRKSSQLWRMAYIMVMFRRQPNAARIAFSHKPCIMSTFTFRA